ncbi:MAG: hypothetical protein BMS9Abin28_1409 [Anaerolineae bacterium]|nr:MAG: hypothetical protein BMS9Abin28_1409 [Anaerolineae bacterium]
MRFVWLLLVALPLAACNGTATAETSSDRRLQFQLAADRDADPAWKWPHGVFRHA